MPGFPPLLRATWEQPGAALRLELPVGALNAAAAIQLRVLPDPLDARNAGASGQPLELALVNRSGDEVVVVLPADTPALRVAPVPPSDADLFIADWEGAAVSPGQIRLPLTAFGAVDLANVVALELRMPAQRGALLLGEVELVRR